jgi:uncharacterized delta-60 repeat protein
MPVRKGFLLGLLIVAVSCSWALAVPGSLDRTFDGDGRVTFDGGWQEQGPVAVAVQLDGKLVVVGRSYSRASGASRCTIVRFDSTGALDPTFDADEVWACTDVAVQGDGKIVVGGGAVARLNADGTLDASFSGDGIASAYDDFSLSVSAVAIQADGKIVAVGTSDAEGEGGIAAIVRFNADGTIDRSFAVQPGPNGMRELGRWYGRVSAVSIQPNGKILVAGHNFIRGRRLFSLYRLLPNGAHDATFGGDGTVRTQWRGDSVAAGVVRQADGKIVATGYSGEWPDLDFALARYTRGGRLDTTFSDDGKKRTDFHGGLDVAHALVIQPNGRIVVAGEAAPPTDRVMRPSGSPATVQTASSIAPSAATGSNARDLGPTTRTTETTWRFRQTGASSLRAR